MSSTKNDLAVLKQIRDGMDVWGVARFNSGRYSTRVSAAPSRTILKRLSEEGYIEVESHNVSTWGYGFTASYYTHSAASRGYPLTDDQKADLAREQRIKAVIEPKMWQDRTEVWVRMTTRGREYMETLALVH
jgi:hypothetical protein